MTDGLIAFTFDNKPQDVERFNRTVRYEWLYQYYWSSIEEVQDFATQWMWS
jgi:putative transposase